MQAHHLVRPVASLVGVFGVLLIGAACAGVARGGAESAQSAELPGPTFYADVLPVLQQNCQVCHMDNGQNSGGMVAPMALTDYATTAQWAPRIKRAVESGRMPPWHADEEHKGVFRNERILEDSDIALLAAWADAGAPAGDPADAPAPRVFASQATGWTIGEPDIIVKLTTPFEVHDSIEDLYIDFEVPITSEQLPEDRWVKAVEFRPGSSAVHHVIATPIGGIAPGYEPRVYPQGYGRLLRAGTTVNFQMHYHKTPGEGTAVWDQTEAAIIFYEPGEIIEHVVEGESLGMFRFVIPANDPNYSFKSEYTFEKDAHIVWLNPHMHLRGKAALYELTYPGKDKETLLSVSEYDFNWQHTYTFEEPVFVPAGTKIDLTLWWDNSADNASNPDPNRDVRWGRPTTDEMGYGFMSFIDVESQRIVVAEVGDKGEPR